MPQVPTTATPVRFGDLAALLRPELGAAAVGAAAVIALENGRGAKIHNHNWGNLMAGPEWRAARDFWRPGGGSEFVVGDNLFDTLTAAGLAVRDERIAGGPHAFLGVMLHHTGTPAPGDVPSVGLLLHGRRGISGPLSNLLIGREGTIVVISEDEANHAGPGRSGVLDATAAGLPPVAVGGDDLASGNQFYIGIELENSGNEPYPATQRDALFAVLRALLTEYQWGAERVISHNEWTGRKVDPDFIMGDFRAALGELLAVPGQPSAFRAYPSHKDGIHAFASLLRRRYPREVLAMRARDSVRMALHLFTPTADGFRYVSPSTADEPQKYELALRKLLHEIEAPRPIAPVVAGGAVAAAFAAGRV